MLWSHQSVNGSAFWMIVAALLVFPRLALGLSGFETGVVVMPLVKSEHDLPPDQQTLIHTSQVGYADLPEAARRQLE